MSIKLSPRFRSSRDAFNPRYRNTWQRQNQGRFQNEGWANALRAPRHSGFAPSRQGVSAIRRVSAFAGSLLTVLVFISIFGAVALLGGL